jgi:hypothetical protein
MPALPQPSSWRRRCRRTTPACPLRRACCWPPWQLPSGERQLRRAAPPRPALLLQLRLQAAGSLARSVPGRVALAPQPLLTAADRR